MIIAPKRWRQFVIPLENGIIISRIGSISLDGNDDDDDDDDNGCCIGPLKQFFTHSHLQCNPQKLSRPIRACIDLPANRVRQRPPPPPWQNKLEYLKTGDVGSVLNRHSRRRRCLCPVTLTPSLPPSLPPSHVSFQVKHAAASFHQWRLVSSLHRGDARVRVEWT